MSDISSDAAVLVARLFHADSSARYRADLALLASAVDEADEVKLALDGLLVALSHALSRGARSLAGTRQVQVCTKNVKSSWCDSPVQDVLLALIEHVVGDVETGKDVAIQSYQELFDAKYMKLRSALDQATKVDTAAATASSQLAPSPSMSSTSTSSSLSFVSNSASTLTSVSSSSATAPIPSPSTTSSSSSLSANHWATPAPTNAAIIPAATAAAPAPVPVAAPIPAPAPAPAPPFVAAPAHAVAVPAAALASVVGVSVNPPIILGPFGGLQNFPAHANARPQLPLELLSIMIHSVCELEELLNVAMSTHGLRAAVAYELRTVHLQRATLATRDWLRAANIAFPHPMHTCVNRDTAYVSGVDHQTRARPMKLDLDFRGESNAAVAAEAQWEVERLLPHMERLRMLTDRSISPTFFNAPANFLQRLDLGDTAMPSVTIAAGFFGGAAPHLSKISASTTAFKSAVSYTTFESATPKLKIVEVQPDAAGCVHTATLEDVVRWRAMDLIDVRGAPDMSGTGFDNREKTTIVKLNMPSLDAFHHMTFLLTADSFVSLTNHLALAGAGARPQALKVALAFLEEHSDDIEVCAIFAIGEAFQLSLKSANGRCCSLTALSEFELAVLLTSGLAGYFHHAVQGLRTVVIPWRVPPSVMAGIILVLSCAPNAVDVSVLLGPPSPLDATRQVSLASPELPALIRGNLCIYGHQFRQRGDDKDCEDQPFDAEDIQMPFGDGTTTPAALNCQELLTVLQSYRPFGGEVSVSDVRLDDAPDEQIVTDSGIRVIKVEKSWTV